jgi:hypothetical protein
MTYDYSFTTERPLGLVADGESSTKGKIRYRGRCVCGRTTHQWYSSAGLALTAIRSVHNANIPKEECNP